jgi:hypothetical protein
MTRFVYTKEMHMADATIYIAINEDDDYETATDAETAIELLRNNFGGQYVKVYALKLNDLPAPSIEETEIEVNITQRELAGHSVTVKIG